MSKDDSVASVILASSKSSSMALLCAAVALLVAINFFLHNSERFSRFSSLALLSLEMLPSRICSRCAAIFP